MNAQGRRQMILPNARRAPRHGACRHQGARRTGAALPNDGSGGWAGLPRIDTHDTLKERPEALRGRSGSRIIGRDRFIVARLCGHTNIGPVSENHRTLSRGVRGPQRVPCRQGETGMILKGTATLPDRCIGWHEVCFEMASQGAGRGALQKPWRHERGKTRPAMIGRGAKAQATQGRKKGEAGGTPRTGRLKGLWARTRADRSTPIFCIV